MKVSNSTLTTVDWVHISDVNDSELLIPSRDFWFLMPSRDFHFRKKTSPSRAETLTKRARAELRL